MNTIRLSIPARNNTALGVTPNVANIKKILDSLPLANPAECGAQISALLYRLNRAPIDTQVRMNILRLMLPLIEDIANSLRNHYISAELPLTERPQQSYRLIRSLNAEMGYGYKIIVHDLFENSIPATHGSSINAQAVCYALSFLSRQLVDAYALYLGEPKHVWLEVNQLYLYAERNQFHETHLSAIALEHQPSPVTIANIYKRIVLLALANPYHLMQGEAVKMFNYLKEWCTHCDISPLTGTKLPDGKLFVDLAIDAPPMYTPKTQAKVKAVEGRQLEIKDLFQLLEGRIRTLTMETKAKRGSSLVRRMERDMYFRWAEAWGLRRERMSHRRPRKAPASLICGLSAAHHIISHGEPFSPEEQELRLTGYRPRQDDDANGDYEEPGSSLSLIPEEHSSWTGHDPTANPLAARSSHFGAIKDRDDRAMWIRVFTTSSQMAHELIHDEDEEDYLIHDCEIRNANQGGYGIFCHSEAGFPARVGELIAAQSESDPDVWATGSIKWMKLNDRQDVELGVRIIAEESREAATKAMGGVGKGSEFYRALIIPDLDPRQFPTTLITPAAVYDIGSLLKVILSDQVLYIKLTRQLESSSSFSHYQFEIVDPLVQEHDRTENQEERMSRNLFR